MTSFRRPADPRSEVDRELAFHLEMRVRELVAQGVSPEAAREQALRRFGNYHDSRVACVEIDERRERRMTRTSYLTEIRQDLAYAVRMLARAPGFTCVAIVTLALGIGANSAIFSVVHGVLLQSLPFRDADRLYRVRTVYPDGTPYALSAADFMSVRQDNRVFDQVEAYSTTVSTMTGAGDPREAAGAQVSDGLFTMLGLAVGAGRPFDRRDHDVGRANVAILDHGFWQRQFGADPSAVGRTISLAGRPYTIVGVLRREAKLTVPVDVYAPLEYGPPFSAATAIGRRGEFLAVIAHARPEAGKGAIQEDLQRVGTALKGAFPQTNAGLSFGAIELTELIVGDVRAPLFVLLGAVGFVLLIVCANVGNLLLARASARQQEIAVRAALGAGRGRLIRQLVTESLVLGLVGGALGLALAYGGTAALIAARPADIPRLDQIGVSPTVVAFTLLISLAAGLAFGLVPALQFTGRTLTKSLRSGGRGSASAGEHRMRATLVVAEMALAVVLLSGAGLLLRSFVELTRVDPGFRADQAIAFRIMLQGPEYQRPEQIRSRVADLQERLKVLPGVSLVGLTTVLPLSGRGSMLGFGVVGAPPPPPDVNAEIAVASVSPDYFAAIGAAMRRGRGFSDRDTSEAPPVSILNEAAVRRWFPGQNPIGQSVQVNGLQSEVVGVVADVLQQDPGQPAMPQLYAPYAQRTSRSVRVVVRAANDAMSQAPAIRTTVHALDPNVAIMSITPLVKLVDDSVARPRFYASLLTLFAAVALVLAASGVFGVMSYAVAQRAKEISIRMALGAPVRDVVGLVVGRALALAGAGVVLGLAATLALGRVIQGQLFGVDRFDPVTLGAVVLVLTASAAIASFVPARRAAAVDPANALRT